MCLKSFVFHCSFLVFLAVFQSADGDGCFTVRPEELALKAGEEQGVVVSFTAHDTQKHKERHVHSYRFSFCTLMRFVLIWAFYLFIYFHLILKKLVQIVKNIVWHLRENVVLKYICYFILLQFQVIFFVCFCFFSQHVVDYGSTQWTSVWGYVERRDGPGSFWESGIPTCCIITGWSPTHPLQQTVHGLGRGYAGQSSVSTHSLRK